MTKLVISLILGFASLAPAATLDIRSQNASKMISDKDRGGGNAVNDQLFDFYENEGTEKVDVRKLPVYQQVLVPLFKKLDAKLPALSFYLTSALKTKNWYLEPKPLSEIGCTNSSMIKVRTTIVACQSQFEVRMDSNWLNANTTTPQQAAALIMHELLVAKMMQRREHNTIQEESVRYLNRLFFSNELPSATELQKILNDRGFEELPTIAESKKVIEIVQKYLSIGCQTTAGSITAASGYEKRNLLTRLSMSGERSLAERHEFLVLSNEFTKLFGRNRTTSISCADIRQFINSYDGKKYNPFFYSL